MAPFALQSTEVIDLLDSDEEGHDVAPSASRPKVTAPKVHRRQDGKSSVRPNSKHSGQIAKQVHDRTAQSSAPSPRGASTGRMNKVRPQDSSAGRPTTSSDSRLVNALPPGKRQHAGQRASVAPRTHGDSRQDSLINTLNRDGDRGTSRTTSKQNAGSNSRPTMPGGQLMPSSSNGIAMLKRQRDEDDASPDSSGAKRKKLDAGRRHYSSSSPAPGVRPAKIESSEHVSAFKSTLQRAKLDHHPVAMVDLTRDDDQEEPRLPRRNRTIQFSERDGWKESQTSSANPTSRGSRPGVPQMMTTKSQMPLETLRMQSAARKNGNDRVGGAPARSSRTATEKRTEIPESPPGTTIRTVDYNDGGQLDTNGLQRSKSVSATKSKSKSRSSPPAARTSPDKVVSKSFPGTSIADLKNRPFERFKQRQSEARSQSQTLAHEKERAQQSDSDANLQPLSATSRHRLQSSTDEAKKPTAPSSLDQSPARSTRITSPEVPEREARPLPLSPSDTSADESGNCEGPLAGTDGDGPRMHANDSQSTQKSQHSQQPPGPTQSIEEYSHFRAETTPRNASEDEFSTSVTQHKAIIRDEEVDSARLQELEQPSGKPQDSQQCTDLPDRAAMTPDSTFFHQQASTHFSDLKPAERAEKIVGRYLEELQADNEHWIKTWLKRARVRLQGSCETSLRTDAPTDVFSKMKPLHLDTRPHKKLPENYATIISESHLPMQKKEKKTYSVPCTIIKTHEEDVPNYSHYVSISKNFLANNETTLQHWPYFGDDFDMRVAEGLQDQYYVDVVDRRAKLHRLGKAEHFAPYAEDMLKDMGCEWSDVLRFLLDPVPDVGPDEDARKVAAIRDTYCKEEFSRSQRPWTTLLSKLPAPDSAKIGQAALLCERFQSLTKLSLWHIARRSEYTFDLLRETEKMSTMDELTCRVCMRFNCPYHGEINDTHESDDEDDGIAGVKVVDTDIIHPPAVNFRTRVGFPSSIDDREVETTSKDRRSLKYWQNGPNAHLLFRPDERGPFYPCHHPGQSCSSAHCSCFENKIPCEKTCACPPGCPRKFQGCNCATHPKRKGRKRVCFEEESCACFQLGRECDPDLCGDCGVCEVLDPVNRSNDQVLDHRCSNASIQRGLPKHTVLGDSAVHGLGLYACEPVREHDFLGEYKGEIIMKEEAERRGAVYEHQKLSYLFTLNQRQEIDSTYFGNKVRFINHAVKNKCNLYPRIIMVNTVHRIALYAQRNIRAGEELFFDYGPMFPGDQLGGTKGRKTDQAQSKAAPHVRNAGLVKGFHDVEHDEDEMGNLRAVKATGKPRGRPRLDRVNEDGNVRRSRPRKIFGQREDAMDIDDQDDEDEDEDDGKSPYGDLSMYNIIDDNDDAELGPFEVPDLDGSGDDEDFEPEDSASVVSEEPEASESESESDSDDEPTSTARRGGDRAGTDGSIRARLEQIRRRD